jgi:hypothetical protein
MSMAAWTESQLPWSSFTQPGGGTLTLDGADIIEIRFLSSAGTEFDWWVDQVGFYPDPAGYTFDANSESWTVITANPAALLTASSVSFAPSTGNPAGGSIQLGLAMPFTGAADEYVQIAPGSAMAPIDLSDQIVTAWLRVESATGTADVPAGAYVFAQDSDWTWGAGTWANLSTVGEWIQLTLDPSTVADVNFDPTDVVRIGVWIGTGTGATFLPGVIAIDNVVYQANTSLL